MRALLVVALLATNAHAIVGGTPSTDPSVVALVRGEGAATELVCSGVVVAPHAVLTAAHCVIDDALPDAIIDGERARPIAKLVLPGFDAATLENDLAVVVFDRSFSIPPRDLAITTPVVGESMQLVGFGRTAPDDATPFMQRTGVAPITESEPTGIVSHGPSFTCEGDSGGPALIDERVAGVTSSGDAQCAEHSRHTRIGVVELRFVLTAIAATAPEGAHAGDRCWYAANCAESSCTPAADDPRLSFCAPGCMDGMCSSNLVCIDELCRHPLPSPGVFGSRCANDDACLDGLCVAPEGPHGMVCTQRCFSDLPGFECPSGYDCVVASDGSEACFRPDDGGCCSSSRSNASWIALLVFAQLLRGRGRPYASRRESSVLREMPSMRAARV